jgi:2,4-dichlorophenol 6-monooxygenase
MWLRNRGIGRGGAVLVRPDRFVGWRSAGASDRPLDQLAGALGRILAQPLEINDPPLVGMEMTT